MRRLVPIALVWLLAVLAAATSRPVAAQVQAPAPGPMAETVFKNIQVLKGIPVDEFMDTMGMFSAALGYDCASCHSPEIRNSRAAFAISTPTMQKARQMVLMMHAINRTNFAGVQRVSCDTCHRGAIRPEVVPSLAQQYGDLFDDPSAMEIALDRGVTAAQVFDKYIQAIGGAGRVAALMSYTATGTYAGFNTGGGEVPVEILARAPDKRTQIVRMKEGDGVKTYDGREGWVAEEWRPVPLLALTGSNLAGARVDAIVAFPAGIRAAFSEWKVGAAALDAKPVQILHGSNPGELPVNLYFDEDGLLVRTLRWNKTAVGTVPTQVDYADYRDVAGVKMPFRLVVTWTDGQNTIALREVKPNVAIDGSRFARPPAFTRR